MKRWIALAALLCANPAGRAGDDRVWNIRVELQTIAVPTALALQLVPALRQPATFAAAEARVRALVASGEAELVDWTQVRTMSGQKSTSESVGEVQYDTPLNLSACFPTIYTPFAQRIRDERDGLTPSEGARRTLLAQQWWETNFPPTASQGNPTTPTAFDTRNTGVFLEVEPQFDEVKNRIDLSLAAQSVHLVGFETTLGGRPGPPTVRGPAQPRFSTFMAQTNFTVANGETLLLDTVVESVPRPRMLLFLLHTVAEPVSLSIP